MKKMLKKILTFYCLPLVLIPTFSTSCSKKPAPRTWSYEVTNVFNKNNPFEIIGEATKNYSFTYELPTPVALFQISLINTKIDLVSEKGNFEFYMRKNQGALSWYDIGQGVDKITFTTTINDDWTKSYTQDNKPKYSNTIFLTDCTVNFNEEYFSTTTQFNGSQKVWFDYASTNPYPEKIHTIDYYFHFFWKK